MIDLLARWNRWGTATLASGHARDLVPRLVPFLTTKDVIGLVGPRRAGKSTVLYQLMDALGAQGVAAEQMLHVNFEDPAFAPELGTELLDRVYTAFRDEVVDQRRAFLFFDEIQVVPGWERWVRARNESEDVKIFVTGSSAKLLSRELGTALTGRHVTFRVHPLAFGEFLRFRGTTPPKGKFGPVSPAVQRALAEYVRFGGFPEVVLAKDERRKELLLKQYFDDLIYRDVALRHEVRDLHSLRALAVHLLTQTGCLVSFQRLANLLGISVEQARRHCSHLQEAMLVELLPICSTKVAERVRNPQKVFAIDTGLRNAVCFTTTPDHGALAETVVHSALQRQEHDGLGYWRNGSEIDLVVRRGTQITRLVQVAYELDRDGTVMARETTALAAAGERFPAAEQLLVVQNRIAEGTGKRTGPVRAMVRFLLTEAQA